VELLTSVQYLGYLPPAVVGISQVQTTFHFKLAAKFETPESQWQFLAALMFGPPTN
jgi:hypothetical protein